MMLTKRAFLLHYRALAEYADLRTCVDGSDDPNSLFWPLNQQEADYIWHFLRPYVCVIHEPTGHGYYLDRKYQLIISVRDITRPGSKEPDIPTELLRVVSHETALKHQAASFTTPDWASKLPLTEFTTYWLY